jgi:choline dehydrogenase-like flavoprotein
MIDGYRKTGNNRDEWALKGSLMVATSAENWFDFIIIGSGSAGAVLAARLSEDPSLRIALIEVGGATDDPRIADPLGWPGLQGSAVDWGFVTVPQRHTAYRIHAWPRGRVLGGSSAINAMAHVRGHPSDFDAWANAGCAGWSFRDLLPYFIRSETSPFAPSPYHGNSGPIHLIWPCDPHPITLAYMAAGSEIGLAPTDEHNGACMTGPTLNSLTIRHGRRQTVADAYLGPMGAEGSNLAILSRTRARSLIIEDEIRCRGVQVSGDGGTTDLKAERGVVLAAGSIGSPTLLLQSGIGPADELRSLGIPVKHDLPGVGANLHDHLLAGGNLYRARREVTPSKYQHSESLMYIEREGAAGAPELVLACVIAPVVTEMFERPLTGSAYTIMFGFTHPRSRGRLRLASANPDVPPLIDPNYLAEEYDRRAFLDALEIARAVGGAGALADWRAEELLPGLSCATNGDRLAFVEKAATTHHHPVGTCRMGIDDLAVVGPDLRLRGIEGLYVVDASIMPEITTGPVNAAVVAMAERASDLLRGRRPLSAVELPDEVRLGW